MRLTSVHAALVPAAAGGPFAGVRAGGPSVVAIGKFDGLHRGHRVLLERVLDEARQRGCQAGVVTFDAHPAEVLHARAPVRLTSLAERRELIAELGLDFLVVLKATPELFATQPEEFTSALIRALDLRVIVVGAGFRFGQGASGDVHTMRRAASPHDVDVIGIDIEQRHGRPVSSTQIRELLALGRIDIASELLGRPFAWRTSASSPTR